MNYSFFLKWSLTVSVSMSLVGCSNIGIDLADTGGAETISSSTADSLRLSAISALRRSDASTARNAAQQLVLADPRSHQAHLLLAASHQLAGDPASLDLAMSGYEAAKQFSGSNAWPSLLAGMAALQRKDAKKAVNLFANAVIADPDNSLAFEGLAAAAYASGRIELAQASAKRAQTLDPNSAIGWRLATLSAAAKGEQSSVDSLLNQPPSALSAIERNFVNQRSQVLLRTAAFDTSTTSEPENKNDTVIASTTLNNGNIDTIDDDSAESDVSATSRTAEVMPGASNQLTVEVTLILSDLRDTTKYGVNLLDSLQSIYSMGRSSSSTTTTTGGVSSTDGAVTITRAIKTPDLAYNLNVFNKGKRSYEVIARPSLTAFAGEQSAFFVGEQLKVGVSGINTAGLETVDVGVSLKVTPNQIRTDGAQFRIEADRSFFGDQGAGRFSESVALFKQSVAATADVRFGETLILSGLSESVSDGQESGVPILGDIPGINLLFHNEAYLKRGRSVLVLVTPSLPASFARTRDVDPALTRLVHMWDTVIEKTHGIDALTSRLQHSRKFTRAAAEDIAIRNINDPKLLDSLFSSTIINR
ncbi:MAG: tetratricopeptide repeat protein [Candidatus Thiothrix moscowensis]|nr:tetratricopeptide repeat protein [Candidatus Thiothrix moscowensis]